MYIGGSLNLKQRLKLFSKAGSEALKLEGSFSDNREKIFKAKYKKVTGEEYRRYI